jgi:hypothetical protein
MERIEPKKPFWDLEENEGFIDVVARDGLKYKVWNTGSHQSIEKVANILSKSRRAINQLLAYMCRNRDEWKNDPIAFGIYLAFDIHAHKCGESVLNDPNAVDLINTTTTRLFNYQEMTPNKYGILGLNKPKQTKYVSVMLDNKEIKYELATRRSIFLTIRPKIEQNPELFDKPEKIFDLLIHEFAHTVCNDTQWKQDNHKHPYNKYHNMIIKFAERAGIKKDFLKN